MSEPTPAKSNFPIHKCAEYHDGGRRLVETECACRYQKDHPWPPHGGDAGRRLLYDHAPLPVADEDRQRLTVGETPVEHCPGYAIIFTDREVRCAGCGVATTFPGPDEPEPPDLRDCIARALYEHAHRNSEHAPWERYAKAVPRSPHHAAADAVLKAIIEQPAASDTRAPSSSKASDTGGSTPPPLGSDERPYDRGAQES